ncbi:MAG TPA: RES family NAD+ phosphorylase [Rhizomicrobium sp.]|jgi:RES domain-containing protein|nr:RES family NAD+ phosphorylase [Rhizomicrobium sp.]
MILWRLSGTQHARAFDGGYGLLYDGRWNTAGRAVTYCATSPSLCVLEKLVHIEDPELLPAIVMVRYNVPDDLSVDTISIAELPASWRLDESRTQELGNAWHAASRAPLLRVPSAIVPLEASADVNVLINHRHPAAREIRFLAAEPFVSGTRLY